MLRASSVKLNKPLSANLSFAKIPLFKDVEFLLEKGLCPLGSQRNLETAASLTTFSKGLGIEQQLLLADAQTSGGLLMAVPKEKVDVILSNLRSNNVLESAVIGEIEIGSQAGTIQVGL